MLTSMTSDRCAALHELVHDTDTTLAPTNSQLFLQTAQTLDAFHWTY